MSNVPNHVVQRGRNRDPVFYETADYLYYLTKLKDALIKYDVKLHAYVLMTNHVHLLMSAKEVNGVSLVMQYVGRFYVSYINHKYGFSGSLWEGRFKSNLIDSDRYLFACMRYIELNPVRAGMVLRPDEYVYSSYHCNALNLADELITPHTEFVKLSDKPDLRSVFYANLFEQVIPNDVLAELKAGYQSGTPAGSGQFKESIEKVLQRKLGYSVRGRPKKNVVE
ncbi:transposase [Thiomicrorhabdus sp. Kp2]|uniref:transposase n=1 Tax=Thiomicrorhabdus sp. Kp2 TaxID=1123518 RepID=UPI0004025DD2|nr:transposase [Thiomicrorhabdus sp. Kp2]